MRKLSFIFASLLLVVTMYAQDLKAIKLSSPDKNRGSSIMKEGAYLYDAKANSLQPIAKGDHRAAVAGSQDFVKSAPVSLVLVSDLSRFGNIADHTKLMAAVDAGIVCQNINIFCAATGLATVPRATMDQAALKRILKLTDSQLPIMNNPVGYPRE